MLIRLTKAGLVGVATALLFVSPSLSAPPTRDTTPPTVAAVTPTNGATGVAVTAKPTAQFNEKVGTPTASNFSISGSGVSVALTVGWKGNTNTATLTPTVSLVPGTDYTVRVTGVADSAGNVMAPYQWAFKTAGSVPPPSDTTNPVAALSVSSGGEAPVEVTADASASRDNVAVASYAFNWGDGATTPTQTGATATHTYTSAGSYTVVVTVKDAAGNSSTASGPVDVTDPPPPPPSDNPPVAMLSVTPASGTAPLSVTGDAGASTDDTGIVSYAFTFGDGTSTVTQSSATLDHEYTDPGTYTASVVVTDTKGQTTTAEAQVAVAAPLAPAKPTTVSLTFDDGTVGHLTAADILNQYRMKGTFYINSGRLGAAGYMTSAQLQTIAAAGHEIAGHTVNHADLATLSSDDVLREVCNDRVSLSNLGFTVKNFAYPFGSLNASVKQSVQSCGYNSARSIANLKSLPYGCANCATANTLPPPDPYVINTNSSVKGDTTLATLQSWVIQAEQGNGGWVPLVIHHVGTAGGSDEITPTTLTQFVQWLSQRPSTTVVKTVDAVIGGSVKPVVAGPPLPTQPGNLVQNWSLELSKATTTTAPGGGTTDGFIPTCFQFGYYNPGGSSNRAAWVWTTDAHSGQHAERVDMTGWVNGDRKLVMQLNTGDAACAPIVNTSHTYRASVWYKGSGTGQAKAQMVFYYLNSAGVWTYWDGHDGPQRTLSSTYTQTSVDISGIPAGATRLSFGLALVGGNGSLTTDDYSLVDLSG